MTRRQPVRMAAVLGAGTMGAQIAAHLANAGVPALLLDLTHEIARDGLKRATALKPDPFFTAERLGLDRDWRLRRRSVAPGRRRTGSSRPLSNSIDIKRALLERVDAARRARHHRLFEHLGYSDRLARGGPQRRFPPSLAGHAFLQPAALSAPARADSHGRDRPGRARAAWPGSPIIISARASSSRRTRRTSSRNHIGLFGVMQVLRRSEPGDYTIEEIDAITGPALGRPKSATFRTMDIAGIDVLAHVAAQPRRTPRRSGDAQGVRAAAARRPDDRARTGSAKSRAGLLQTREERPDGIRNPDARSRDADLPAAASRRACPRSTRRAAIDDVAPTHQDAVPRARTGSANSCARRWARRSSTPPALRLTSPIRSTMSIARCGGDLAGSWVRSKRGTRLASRSAGSVADRTSRRSSPLAARSRPFATAACRRPRPICRFSSPRKSAAGRPPQRRRQPGRPRRRRAGRRIPLEDERDRRRHRPDAARGTRRKRRPTSRRSSSATTRPNFSAGANLMLLLMEAQEENWDEIDLMVRAFQGATQALRLSRRAGHRRAGRAGARRRLRDRAARRPRPGRGGKLHRPGRSRASA